MGGLPRGMEGATSVEAKGEFVWLGFKALSPQSVVDSRAPVPRLRLSARRPDRSCLNGAHRIVALTNDPLTGFRKQKAGVRGKKRLGLRLDYLGDQAARARTQDFRERVADFVFLAIGNVITGQGLTLFVGAFG
jgi:hypothetical protein